MAWRPTLHKFVQVMHEFDTGAQYSMQTALPIPCYLSVNNREKTALASRPRLAAEIGLESTLKYLIDTQTDSLWLSLMRYLSYVFPTLVIATIVGCDFDCCLSDLFYRPTACPWTYVCILGVDRRWPTPYGKETEPT